VHEQRRHGRIDAAAERTQHAFAPDLGADPLHLLLDHGGGRPRRRRVGDVVEEVLQDLGAVRRMHDLGVELDAVQPPLGLLECGDRRRGRARDHPRAGGRRGHRVSM
jgi:hypothetical protein